MLMQEGVKLWASPFALCFEFLVTLNISTFFWNVTPSRRSVHPLP